MQNVRVAIVGAGLAGLYAAYVLEKKGIKDYVVLEARGILGGRIASTIHSEGQFDVSGEGFDLGPAWFWPAFAYSGEREHSFRLNVNTFFFNALPTEVFTPGVHVQSIS